MTDDSSSAPRQSGDRVCLDRLDYGEVLKDVTTVSGVLRDGLPIIIREAAQDGGWPDTMLADVICDMAEAVGRLDGAEGLLRTADEGSAVGSLVGREAGGDA